MAQAPSEFPIVAVESSQAEIPVQVVIQQPCFFLSVADVDGIDQIDVFCQAFAKGEPGSGILFRRDVDGFEGDFFRTQQVFDPVCERGRQRACKIEKKLIAQDIGCVALQPFRSVSCYQERGQFGIGPGRRGGQGQIQIGQ